MQWSPTQSFALPTESQLGRGLLADAGQFAENKFVPNAQNLALLQSLGYSGPGIGQMASSEELAGANLPVWSDDARTWLANNGYSLGVAHDEGTSAGGRPEYFGLMGPNGQFVNGQSDPSVTLSDTLMDQIAMFAMMLGGAGGMAAEGAGLLGAGAGAGSGMAGIAADGVSMGSSGLGASAGGVGAAGAGAASGLTADQLFQQAAQQALETSGNYYMQSLPGQLAMDAGNVAAITDAAGGTGAAGGLGEMPGNSLVQNQNNTFWDKVQSGAQKGAIKGGVTSGIKGENPLKGAVMGGLSGAVGGGIGSIGDGSLGNAMSLDNGGGDMGLIQGGFDGFEPGPTDVGGLLGSIGGAANTGGNMGWTEWLSGLSGGGSDVGSFGDNPGFSWDSTDWAGYNPYGVSGTDLPDYQPSQGLDWDKINQVLNQTPTQIGDDPQMTGGVGSTWLDALKGVFGQVPKEGGGMQANPLGGLLMGLIGAGAGAASGGGTNTSTQQQQMDPRMQGYIYGSGAGDPNSITGAAQQLWQQNKTGLNPTMQQGLDMQRAALTDPAYGQAYTQMRDLGSSLMSRPVAGNPFTSGAMPNFGGSVQDLISSGGGLLGNAAQPPQAQPAQPVNGLLGPAPTMQAGGPGGLITDTPEARARNLMMRRPSGLLG